MKNNLTKIILVCCLAIIPLIAQKASIRGVVTDAKTGNPLIGVNIMLKGTYYGAATDINGSYIISGMGPGSYDMQVSMMGYKQLIHGGITLRKGESKRMDLKLEPTVLALGEDVVVVGDKPIIDAASTSSSVSVSSGDLLNKIAENVGDIISQQAGVSESNNEIHIRGGRVDESQFIVDGLSIKDPLTGRTSGLYVNPNAIEELELITGGFNAEYGQAMSGIIDVKLKEGAPETEGSIRYKTDQIFFNGVNTDNIEFSVGGPLFDKIKFIPGHISYFFSGYLYWTDTYLPQASRLYPFRSWMQPLTLRQENNFSGMAKLSWNVTQKHKFSISYNKSGNVNQGYFSSSSFPYSYSKILDNYPTYTRESEMINAKWTQTISSRLFFNLNAGYFYTGYHKAVQNKDYTEYEESLDLDPNEYLARDEYGNVTVFTGDEFWDHGDSPYWYDYWSRNFTLSGDITYQPTTKQKVKAGFSHRFTDMQVIDIYKPWMGGSGLGESYDYYRVKPSDGSVYIQDKIVFEGMIANIGIRYDYWFIGKYVTEAMKNPNIFSITSAGREKYFEETFNFFGRRGKGHVSPRLGISHPVTDNDVLYFNYGHFSQLPTYNYVYAKLNTVSDNPYNLIGNPNLDPKTTVAYEIGVKHKFSSSSAIEFKAYYKDMFDYETAQSITSFNPLVGNYRLMMYMNMDYARARGLEIMFRQTSGRFFSGDASYTYSISTGKSSTPDDNLLVEAGMVPEKPLTENYLSWDEPFRLMANLRFHVYEDERPYLLGIPMPNNFQISAHIEAQSGRRYTESVINDTVVTDDGTIWYIGTSRSDNPYGEIADPYLTVDLKINKDFYYKNLTYGFYVDIKNCLDFPVPRRINPFTGEPYDPGEIISYSYYAGLNPNEDPSRYYAPRQIMLGLFLRF